MTTTEDGGQNISRSSSMGYNVDLHDDDDDNDDGGGGGQTTKINDWQYDYTTSISRIRHQFTNIPFEQQLHFIKLYQKPRLSTTYFQVERFEKTTLSTDDWRQDTSDIKGIQQTTSSTGRTGAVSRIRKTYMHDV